MKITNAELVEDFMITYGQLPNMMGLGESKALGRRLIEEELDEMDEAGTDRTAQLDAGIDTLYFAYGNLMRLGFTPEQIDMGFQEVHRSNMSKLGEDGRPIYREDGKVLKGPNYFPPDLEKIACLK
jgi:predicted HAD superfamily Cof-like phosphohydrolase